MITHYHGDELQKFLNDEDRLEREIDNDLANLHKHLLEYLELERTAYSHDEFAIGYFSKHVGKSIDHLEEIEMFMDELIHPY